ncbi:unnamed protein product, partial [Scytosiphon promiscuus]
RCLVEEGSRRKGGGVGYEEPESSPMAAAEALFGRGRAMDGGTKAALDAEAMVLQALVPPSELCLEPSVDVSRLAAMVRAKGFPASDDDEWNGGGATKFLFQARHYRVLETLALPGAEDAPDEEQFFLGLGAKRLGKSTKRKLVETQAQIATALRGGRPIPPPPSPSCPPPPPFSATAGVIAAGASASPITKRLNKKQLHSQVSSPSETASPSPRSGSGATGGGGGGSGGSTSPGRGSAPGNVDKLGDFSLSASAAGAGNDGRAARASGGRHQDRPEARAADASGGDGRGFSSPSSSAASSGRVSNATGAGIAAGSGARKQGGNGGGSVLLGAPRPVPSSHGGGGPVGAGGGDGAGPRRGGRSAAEMAVSAVVAWEQGLHAAAAAAAKRAGSPHGDASLSSQGKNAKEGNAVEAKKRAKKQAAKEGLGQAKKGAGGGGGGGGWPVVDAATAGGANESKDTTVAVQSPSGEDEARKKKRKGSTTGPASKIKRKLDEERAISFGFVHRTLLAPVTHLSPANGGRAHDPAVFAKVAKPAQEKAKAIDRKNWTSLAQELARGSDAAAASVHQTGRLTMAVAEGQLRQGLAPDYLAQEGLRQRERGRQAGGDGRGGSWAADSVAKAIKTNPEAMINLRAVSFPTTPPNGQLLSPVPPSPSHHQQHQQRQRQQNQRQHHLPQGRRSFSDDGRLPFLQTTGDPPREGFPQRGGDVFAPGLHSSGRGPISISPTASATSSPSLSATAAAKRAVAAAVSAAGVNSAPGNVFGFAGSVPTPPLSPACGADPSGLASTGTPKQQQRRLQRQEPATSTATAPSQRSPLLSSRPKKRVAAAHDHAKATTSSPLSSSLSSSSNGG